MGRLTLSTNVLSFSGISRGMVVRTSIMAERGMLTLGLEAWEARGRGSENHHRASRNPLYAPRLLEVRAALSLECCRSPGTEVFQSPFHRQVS